MLRQATRSARAEVGQANVAATARFALAIRGRELLQWVEYIPMLVSQASDLRAACGDSCGGRARV